MTPYVLFALTFLLMQACSSETSGKKKRLVLEGVEMNLEQEIINLKKEVADLKRTVSGTGGAVYVRWGRNVCPTTADLIYKGYTGGKHYTEKGSGTNHICLPDDPTWSHYVDGDDTWRGYVYGTELEMHDSEHIFKNLVHNEDIPCAVCQPKGSVTMMIPGRNNCYGNWTREYQGYLMGAFFDHNSTPYICVDRSPEFIQGGAANGDQALLYLIEARCGILQCPPYVEGRELACVVCSK